MTVSRSTISWTDFSAGDANFVLRGKKKGDCEVSEGCVNCYAGQLRLRNASKADDETTYSPMKLARLARVKVPPPFRRDNGRPMVFVVDMGDLFHANVPSDFIMDALAVMRSRPDVDWQVLTKRVERMAFLWSNAPSFPINVWCGVTVENQKRAHERLDKPACHWCARTADNLCEGVPYLAQVWRDYCGFGMYYVCGNKPSPVDVYIGGQD